MRTHSVPSYCRSCILTLHLSQLRRHFDLSIYLDGPDEVCFPRRKVRDITERGRSLGFIQWQYKIDVLPSSRDSEQL